MNTLRALFLLLLFVSPFLVLNLGSQVMINEFVSSNNDSLQDEDGESSDWIELFNGSTESVSLSGYFLSDDLDEPQKWAFPNVELAANEYLIIFCSGNDRRLPNAPLHTNFRLSASGEDVLLVSGSETIQHILPVALDEDEAYALFNGQNGDLFLPTSISSPGAPNLLGANVNFSHSAGFYRDAFSLDMEYEVSGIGAVEIRYTLDGREPEITDPLFSSPIAIDDRTETENTLTNIPCTPDYVGWEGENYYPVWSPPANNIAKGNVVRAAAFLNNRRISAVDTRTFFVFPEGDERYDFPVISISSDAEGFFSNERGIYVPGDSSKSNNLVWSGNYFNSGSDWERVSAFEYFEDGQPLLNQKIGVRIHGGKTRGAAQKSLRLYARARYGQKRFEHPFFPNKDQDSYKRLLLRTTMGAWTNTIIADALAHQSIRDLDIGIQEYRPVIVFLNGEYWGVHTMREHFDEHKIADDNGLDNEDIKMYSAYGDRLNGDWEREFFDLRDRYIVNNDITDPAVYDSVARAIDVNQFIDYFFTQLFFNNPDWPGNNSKMWRSDATDNRFRWIFFDLDGGFGAHHIDDDLLPRLVGGASAGGEDLWPNALIRILIRNEIFKARFIERAEFLLMENLSPTRLFPLAQRMTVEYESEMDEHFARWPGWLSKEVWKENIRADINQFILLRGCEMESQMIDFFGIEPFLNCSEESDTELTIYPNPTGGILNINLGVNQPGLYFCDVHNQLGQLMTRQILSVTSSIVELNLSNLPVGVYFVSLSDQFQRKLATKQVVLH